MRILFIGGTGVISSACAALAVEQGHDLTLLIRGKTARPAPAGAAVLQGDIRDQEVTSRLLVGRQFDVVVNWVIFTPQQMQADIELFGGHTDQYVLISSTAVYQTPHCSFPITETTPRDNPWSAYAEAKIACEDLLMHAACVQQMPVTIVRPSHTYDCTALPVDGGYTIIDRMRRGKQIIVHGDGTSLYGLTHHRDFACGFLGLLGNPQALGQAFHICTDELLSWDQIYQILAQAAGVRADLVHLPSDLIAAYAPRWGMGLRAGKMHSALIDNTKIKHTVPAFAAKIPFAQGAEEIMAWYDADPARRVVDSETDALCDRMIAAYRSAWPSAG